MAELPRRKREVSEHVERRTRIAWQFIFRRSKTANWSDNANLWRNWRWWSVPPWRPAGDVISSAAHYDLPDRHLVVLAKTSVFTRSTPDRRRLLSVPSVQSQGGSRGMRRCRRWSDDSDSRRGI